MISNGMNCVLLIDDSPDDIFINSRILKSSSFADEVIHYSDAEKALAFLRSNREHPIDLILLDINMYPMDGFEFLQQYEEIHNSKQSDTIVIMLTASESDRDIDKARHFSYVSGFATKPISHKKIEEIVERFFSCPAD